MIISGLHVPPLWLSPRKLSPFLPPYGRPWLWRRNASKSWGPWEKKNVFQHLEFLCWLVPFIQVTAFIKNKHIISFGQWRDRRPRWLSLGSRCFEAFISFSKTAQENIMQPALKLYLTYIILDKLKLKQPKVEFHWSFQLTQSIFVISAHNCSHLPTSTNLCASRNGTEQQFESYDLSVSQLWMQNIASSSMKKLCEQ